MLKKIALSLCFTLLLGLLTACSPEGQLHLGKSESIPESSTENAQNTAAPGTIGTPVALPPRFDDEPPKPGQTAQTPLMPNGLPALSPMKGINYNTLFAEKIRDTDERFDRVENAVVDIKKEFEAYKPAIVRLAAVESDIQNLIKELEVLLQETPTPQPPLDLAGGAGTEESTPPDEEANLDIGQLDPQPAPPRDIEKPAPPPPAPSPIQPTQRPPPAPPKVDYGDKTVASNFRVGEHETMVRIAFDTNKDTEFSVELDNDERLIIVELPQATWDSPTEKLFPGTALLDRMSVEPINGGNGSMVIISLKKDTKILQQKHLKPDDSAQYHRVYFDLALY
ncbi:MAG: hypothetical protein ACLFP8_00805 [Alphaproteobacteria bacterium]